MHSLVTGITGFVGGHLAEHLLARGDEVTGCARRENWPDELASLSPRVQFVACDLAEPHAVRSLFDQQRYDAVYHLAGIARPQLCQDQPELARRENTDVTRNLYEAIRHSGQRPRVLFVSTSYVYGQPDPGEVPIRTTCPIRADHAYAATKWAAELLSTRYVTGHGLDIVRVRPFNHTGPRQPEGYVISDWAKQIAVAEREKGQAMVIRVGNLESRRDYTDVRDVVRGYRLLVERATTNEVYNLGCGIGRSGREILDRLLGLTSVCLETVVDPNLVRSAESHEIVADATPLRERTGWKPDIPFDKTLADTLDYWRIKQGDST